MKQVVIKPQTHKRLKAFCKAKGMKIGVVADMFIQKALRGKKVYK